MVSKGPRRSDPNNLEVLRYDEELRRDPPILIWATRPHSGGIQVAIVIKDPPPTTPGPRLNPPCGCDLYGSPRRRKGSHHDEDCGRWAA